jgi:hypothetical protein
MPKEQLAVFRTEILAASKIKIDPVICPTCSGKDLVLYGQLAYPARVTFSNGVETDKQVDFDVDANFEMSSLCCLACEITFEIQSDAETILYMQNSDLRKLFREVTGKDPYGETPC